MKQTSMPAFFIYIRIAIMLIILASILAAILISVDLENLMIFNDIFQIIP